MSQHYRSRGAKRNEPHWKICIVSIRAADGAWLSCRCSDAGWRRQCLLLTTRRDRRIAKVPMARKLAVRLIYRKFELRFRLGTVSMVSPESLRGCPCRLRLHSCARCWNPKTAFRRHSLGALNLRESHGTRKVSTAPRRIACFHRSLSNAQISSPIDLRNHHPAQH